MKNAQETKDFKTSADGLAAEDKRLIRARQRAIGRELKRFYDDVVEEAVPEDFETLLQQIDAAGPGGRDNDSREESEAP